MTISSAPREYILGREPRKGTRPYIGALHKYCVSYCNKQGQTILMVTHSVKAASVANRVLFIKDGEVYHQLYRGDSTDEELYQKISDTLTMLATGGDKR